MNRILFDRAKEAFKDQLKTVNETDIDTMETSDEVHDLYEMCEALAGYAEDACNELADIERGEEDEDEDEDSMLV